MELADAEMGSVSNDNELLDFLDPASFLLDDGSSSSENSPPLISDDSPDSSPPHWSQNFLEAELLPLPEISIDVNTNPELVLFNTLDTQIPVLNSVQTVPIVSSPSTPPTVPSPDACIIKKTVVRSKKRARATDPLPVPTAETQVVLPRDQLLSISSQSMDKFAEGLSSTRSLSLEEQKELKKQKRLIKNRESAQLSRERKRAYITQLEDQIQMLMNENSQLKNENLTLRQALSRYQVVPSSPAASVIKTEPVEYKKLDPVQQHQTKMGSLLTIGGKSATAKAGVCLLIVFFTFGLFMNALNNVNSNGIAIPRLTKTIVPEVLPELSFKENNPLVERFHTPTVGYKRKMMEALPEVLDEENDDYKYEDTVTVLPPAKTTNPVQTTTSSTPVHRHIHPIEVKSAGIFKVSYSPKPAQFLPPGEGEKDVHSHDSENGNSTYMLFLDPRPDLTEGMEADGESTASSTGLVPSDAPSLPPMIISLVVPKGLGRDNGSFPLLPHDGVRAEDSLVEITCKVLDVSITTTEHP